MPSDNEITINRSTFVDLYAAYLAGNITHIFYIDHPNVDLYEFATHFFTGTDHNQVMKLFDEERVILQTEDISDLLGTELPVTDEPPPSFTPHTNVQFTMFKVPDLKGIKVMVTLDRSILN